MILDDMLEVDKYKFKHFPAKWPGQSQNGVNLKKTIRDIKLDLAQTREIAHYYHHYRKQIRTEGTLLEPIQPNSFWANYFGLNAECRKTCEGLLRNLSSRTCRLADGQQLETPDRICTICGKLAEWNMPKMESRALLPPHVEDLNGSSGLSTTAEAVVAQQSDDEDEESVIEDSMVGPEDVISSKSRRPDHAAENEGAEDDVPILLEHGGPQLLIQLEKGTRGAWNPKARGHQFKRNTGYGRGDGDQSLITFRDVLRKDDLDQYGLPIFADYPIRRGNLLEGVDLQGKPLAVNILEHPHNTILVDLQQFAARVIHEYFNYQDIVGKPLFDNFESHQSLSDPERLCLLFTHVFKTIGVFHELFFTHKENRPAPEYDPQRGQMKNSALRQALDLFIKENPNDDQIPLLKMGVTLYWKFCDDKAAAIQAFNWEASDAGPISLKIGRERQAVLTTFTGDLEPLTDDQTAEFSKLQGGKRFSRALQARMREIRDNESFLARASTRRHKCHKEAEGAAGKGKRSRRQVSHADGLSDGIISWVNIGREPTGFGIHLNSGGSIRIIR